MAQSIEGLIRHLGLNCQGDLGPLTCYTSRNGRLVYYPRSPPKEPASVEQCIQRTKFRQAGQLWQMQPLEIRKKWNAIAIAASLRVTGYNLFTYWSLSGDTATITTLINATGINPFPQP